MIKLRPGISQGIEREMSAHRCFHTMKQKLSKWGTWDTRTSWQESNDMCGTHRRINNQEPSSGWNRI